VRVRDRVDVLEELFAKTNRLTLMWAFPFGAGLALFGADLVRFVLGDEWEPAIVLLGGLAAATALQQLGYNWFSFYRARGEPGPQAVESAVFASSFAAFAVPGALIGGSWWFVAGRLACTACVLGVRHRYVRRLLPGVRMWTLAWRAALPVLVASLPVVALRLALWGGERPVWQALGELALWLAGLAVATRRLEAGLLGELWSYLRGDVPAAAGRPAGARVGG
jgi:O-antigen/teichoic acid export membrane protein